MIIKNVGIKPNSADKEAITKMVKLVRGGENLMIFPEGTRSRTSDININFGEPLSLPAKEKDEDKHEYDDRCMEYIMKSIANLLPEKYRGIYK